MYDSSGMLTIVQTLMFQYTYDMFCQRYSIYFSFISKPFSSDDNMLIPSISIASKLNYHNIKDKQTRWKMERQPESNTVSLQQTLTTG